MDRGWSRSREIELEHTGPLLRWGVPLATSLFHLATAPGYGIFRDELYYLACGEHLAWGYVDHPPLIALLAALVRATLGTSPLALRLLPALAAALLRGALRRDCRGARRRAALAPARPARRRHRAGAISLAGVFSMNAFDLLFWAAAFRAAGRAARRRRAGALARLRAASPASACRTR